MDQPYYSSTAYNPTTLPDQPESEERSWIKRFAKIRLPWGSAQDVAPENFLHIAAPKKLRNLEKAKLEREEKLAKGTYVPAPFEHVDFHDRHNHECYRYSLWSKRSHFWIYLLLFGKWTSIIFIALNIPIHFAMYSVSDESFLDFSKNALLEYYSWLIGTPLLAWAAGSIVISYFPSLWIKPSRGPLWELNRRTGLVTVFDYDNNGEYKKNGTIGEITAPFYEFDAYIATSPDRQGLPMNVLYLAHRYRDIVINFGYLVAPDRSPQLPCALWDFFQNYMDTSRPLPDLPCYEQYRHLDPVTAEHDRRTGRDPRYWIDMDDETFKGKVKDMLRRIDAIDTMSPPSDAEACDVR